VECYKPGVKSNDALAERSDPCLALYPTGNASGSWVMFNIKTRRRVRRTNKMVTTQLVIDAVNQLSVDETNGVVIQGDFEDDAGNVIDRTVPAHDNPPVDELINTGVDQPEPEIDDDLPDLVDESDDDEPPEHESDSDEEDDDEPPELVSDSEDKDEEAPPPPSRTSARIASGLRKPERYMVNHMSVKCGLSEYGEAARTAVCDELKQLFIAKKAIMHPVMRDELSPGQRKKIIKSFIYVPQSQIRWHGSFREDQSSAGGQWVSAGSPSQNRDCLCHSGHGLRHDVPVYCCKGGTQCGHCRHWWCLSECRYG